MMNQLLEKQLEFLGKNALMKKICGENVRWYSKIYFFAGVWRLIAEVFSARDGTQFAPRCCLAVRRRYIIVADRLQGDE